MKIIEYKGVDVCQEGVNVLSDVDFVLNQGEYVYLCGKVGSGKSSLLKTMYAELPVSVGDARIFGWDLKNIRKRDVPMLRRKVGIVFQDFKLLTDRSVSDNLEFVLRATGWKNRSQIADQIALVLDTVGMSKKGYKWPHQLSGGEQQRVVIARALLNSPELIIADEPTGNLDPKTASDIVALLHAISSGGTAVIMATHNMQIISDFPGKCYCCEDGRLG